MASRAVNSAGGEHTSGEMYTLALLQKISGTDLL